MFPSVRKTLALAPCTYFRVQDWEEEVVSVRFLLINIWFTPNIFFWGVLDPIKGSKNIVPLLEKDNEDGELVVGWGSRCPAEQAGAEQNLGIS